MHPVRERMKREHIERTTDMHEIIAWPWKQYGTKDGSKLHDPVMWNKVAKTYFVPELTVFITREFNLGSADSARATFLQLKMYEYGPHRVVNALRNMAQYIENPNAYIPYSIDFNGKNYVVLTGDIDGTTEDD